MFYYHKIKMLCIFSNCKNKPILRCKYCNLHRKCKKICIENGCNKNARSRSEKCIQHGGGKRCVINGCNKGAKGKSDKCIQHGGGKRCIIYGCNKSARGKTNNCIQHGGGIRCSEFGCKKSARSKSNKCIQHGGGIRCPNCINWIDSRSGSIKYDGYCATCFKRIFPEDLRSIVIYQHTKEIQVRNAINEISLINPLFKGFIHDRPLYTENCECIHRRRVDHRKLIGNTILAVETDEYAHRGYEEKDEEIRYDDLYMIHSGKWVYIRFNPDNTNKQNIDIEDRIKVLLDVMEFQIKRIMSEENTELVEIIKLFY